MDKTRCSTTSEQDKQRSVDRLIAELEAAAEGNAGLSWEIAEALGWAHFWCGQTIYLPPGEWAEKVKRDPLSVSVVDLPGDSEATSEAPRYTTSLDAALTLVPPNCLVNIDKYLVSDESPDLWRVWIKWLASDDDTRLQSVFSGVRESPALALCIAAMKARKASPQIVAGTSAHTSNTESTSNNTTTASPEPSQ